MKILFDYYIFYHQKLGGISRYFLDLQKYINNYTSSKVDIFAPFHTNEFLKKENNSKLFNFYMKDYPRYSRKIIKFLNYNLSKLYCYYYKPNIIHKTFYSKNINSDPNVKKVITVYDLIHEIYYKEYNQEKGYLPKKEILENVDYVICPSNKTKSDLINFYNINENKIKVIYMGIHKFENIKLENIKRISDPYMLYVGDRKRYKNFNNLIKGLSFYKNILQDFKLICFGGGSFTKAEEKIFADLKINTSRILQIEGDDNQLHYLYKNARTFIFPSMYEGLGLPPLEAMSLGCPVISSNHEAIIEAVGDSAVLFDPNNAEKIGESINGHIYSDDKLNNLKKIGFERSKLFNTEKCAAKTLDLYKEILN